jgi:hypothetical protein
MKIPKATLEGARRITTFWVTAFCDERDTCAHDHGPPPGGVVRRDLFTDLKLIDDLRRFERDDFAPEVPPAAPPPQSSSEARQEDDGTDDARGKRLKWMLRLRWQSHGRWLGVTDDGAAYKGEESAASLGEASP